MQKTLNIFFILSISLFFWSSYKYYSSIKNLKNKEYNLHNIDEIIEKKITNLPVLYNDTNNIIEFNNSIAGEENNDKPRSFWNLLKSK
jgi:hypothetical protein